MEVLSNSKVKCLMCEKNIIWSRQLPYCSTLCRNKDKNIFIRCAVCEEQFHPKQHKSKYCSKECIAKASHIRYKKHTEPVRFKIFSRDNFTCIYCGFSVADGKSLTLDHVYPLIKGGQSDVFNLVTSCIDCNSSKQHKILPRKQILKIWKMALTRDVKSGLVDNYDELKRHFETYYKNRTPAIV